MLSVLHYAVAAPTQAVPVARLSRVRPLSPIDLENFVEESIADPRGSPLAQVQVPSHASMVNVLVPLGPTWHFR